METMELLQSYKEILENLKHSIARGRRKMWAALEAGDTFAADRNAYTVEKLLHQYHLVDRRIRELSEQ